MKLQFIILGLASALMAFQAEASQKLGDETMSADSRAFVKSIKLALSPTPMLTVTFNDQAFCNQFVEEMKIPFLDRYATIPLFHCSSKTGDVSRIQEILSAIQERSTHSEDLKQVENTRAALVQQGYNIAPAKVTGSLSDQERISHTEGLHQTIVSKSYSREPATLPRDFSDVASLSIDDYYNEAQKYGIDSDSAVRYYRSASAFFYYRESPDDYGGQEERASLLMGLGGCPQSEQLRSALTSAQNLAESKDSAVFADQLLLKAIIGWLAGTFRK